MSKIDTVRAAMMQAMKDKNKERKESLSMLLSALKNKAIDKRADLTEEEENAVVLKEIKQCQEAIDTAPAGREDVIQENTARIAVYQEFAPRMMGREEIAAVVDQVLAEALDPTGTFPALERSGSVRPEERNVTAQNVSLQ